jgi:hypothetical protein
MLRYLSVALILATTAAPCGTRLSEVGEVGHFSAIQGRNAGEVETPFMMNYAIAVSITDSLSVNWTVVDLFSSSAWDSLWDELGVTPERWGQWREAHGRLAVVPELPNLSRLAYIDEGPLPFEDALELRAECSRALLKASTRNVKTLLKALARAARAAAGIGGTVVVFPAANGERKGDHYSKPLYVGTGYKKAADKRAPNSRGIRTS